MLPEKSTHDRWLEWLENAKRRAASMEVIAPLATEQIKRRLSDVSPYPSWYEPNPMRYPVQDDPNLIRKPKYHKVSRSLAYTAPPYALTVTTSDDSEAA